MLMEIENRQRITTYDAVRLRPWFYTAKTQSGLGEKHWVA